jgi:hypothetical protein
MRKIFILIFVFFTMSVFAETNGQFITRLNLLIQRYDVWRGELGEWNNYEFDESGVYIGEDYRNYVYIWGMHAGICEWLSRQIDYAITLNLAGSMGASYITQQNSDFFYRLSRPDDWVKNLSEERRGIWNKGFADVRFEMNQIRTRFPDIWEYTYEDE